MTLINKVQVRERIIDQAMAFGVTSARIARPQDLKTSPFYSIYEQNPCYDIFVSLPTRCLQEWYL